MSIFPPLHAKYRGVYPSPFPRLQSAPLDSRYDTMLMCPNRLAADNAELPALSIMSYFIQLKYCKLTEVDEVKKRGY